MKKTILWWLCMTALSIILYFGPVFAQSIPSIGNTITPSQIYQPRTAAECIEPNGATVYVNKQFYFGDTYTTRDTVPRLNSPRDELILTDSEVFTYNPTLFNFTSPIQWKSNWVPYTASLPNVLALEWTFVVNSINPWQIVYHIHRAALGNGWSSNYPISYVWWNNWPVYPAISAILSNKTFLNDSTHVKSGYECVNYAVHYCGDGVIDTQASIAALPGGITTSIANEQCDGTAWVPAGYTCNSSCKLVPNNPTCTLQPSQTIACGGTAVLHYTTNNTMSVTNLMNIWAGTIWLNTAWSFSVSPIQTTTYSFRVNGPAGTTPATCSATVTVDQPFQPTCSLTPANQTIIAGQNAILNFDSHYAISISNLLNITGGLILPNHNWAINITPTQTTVYSFTVNGGACTTPVTCSGTVTVLPPQKPILQIDKSLLVNKLYQSGDLIGWRIDFRNIWSGIAHNVVLVDYLPHSLRYISSQLFGIPLPYNFGTGMFGINPEITYSWFDLNPGQAGYMIITGQLISYELCTDRINATQIYASDFVPAIGDEAMFTCYEPTANLTIDKTINKQIFYPGEYINFTIEVKNNGPDVAQNVKIWDIRPNTSCIIPPTTYTSNRPTTDITATSLSNPYEWTLLAPLNVNQVVIIYLTGQVANTRSCAGNYLNTGTLTYTVNNVIKTGQDVVNFSVPLVNVSFIKTILSHGTTHGDAVSFALDYANNGTEPLSPYDITDYWPGSLTFVSSTVNGIIMYPQTQTNVPGGQILKWHFTTPLAPGWTGRIILNGTIN